jgi:hypothetical protein
LALQDRGQDVVALDISPGALEVCERRGVQHRFLGTMEEFAVTAPEPFDTFLALGNNLGFLESPQRGPRFLRALERLGHAGSVIVGTGLALPDRRRDPSRLSRGEPTTRSTGWTDHHSRAISRARDAMVRLLWCSLEELAEICAPAGWIVTDVFPGWLYGAVLERHRR